VEHFSTGDDTVKASMAEALIKSLKKKLWTWMYHNNTEKWLDVLPDLLENYNNSEHSSIKTTPREASKPEKENQVRDNLYGEGNRLDNKKHKVYDYSSSSIVLKDDSHKVNSLVRISKRAGPFMKAYRPQWKLELFRIHEVLPTQPVTYKLKDLNGKVIEPGIFYEDEVQKVTAMPSHFDVEKVLGKNKDGTLLRIRWKGYSDEFCSWLPRSALKKDKV